MPVTNDAPAPYAPGSAILNIIERHRSRGLPTPVNADVLARAGISQSLIPRTLQALQTLDLIDEQGRPTAVFEGLRLAPEDQYMGQMGEWLHKAYSDSLQFIDPATANETQIRDAFRSYRPVGQQARMVSLFVALFAAAGIGPERPAPTPRNTAKPRAAERPASRQRRTGASHNPPPPPPQMGNLPPLLAGLIASLPSQGQGWTMEDRDRFMNTIGPVIDFCYPLIEADQQQADGNPNEYEESLGHGE